LLPLPLVSLRAFSIRAKLIAMVMVTTCVALAVAGLALAIFEVISHRRTLEKEISTISAILAENSTGALSFDNIEDAEGVLAALSSQSNVLSGCLYDADGRLFASYTRPRSGASCPPAAGEPPGFQGNRYVHHRLVEQGGKPLGTLRLVATLAELRQRMNLFALVLLGVLSVAALAALVLSSALQRVVSRPIFDLATTARRVSERRDYSLRAPHRSDDEVGVAVDAFNQMLARIEDADGALRQAGERSREQARLLQSILDNMGEGMVASDLAGDFMLWNPAATRLIGQGPARGIDLGQWARQYGLYAADGKSLLTTEQLPLARALRNETVNEQEIIVRPDGAAPGQKDRWLSVAAHPLLDDGGAVRGGIAVFRDVTERRHAEEQLRALNATLEQRVAERTAAAEERAAELKRSNEELERFAYVASHDLQEPLRAVASYTQLLRTQLAGKLDGDTEMYLSHVLAGAARMRALINDLLDYSRVGRSALERTMVDSSQVLDGALADLSAAIAESGARISRGELPRLPADAAQLGQLFRNLIVNAIRFRGEQPPQIDLRAERVGDYWRFSVRDNGIGIDARHHERIFVIFQRLHGRERPGTGIGLAICRKIVDRHGGRIWVESEPGKGATFLFTLPVEGQGPP
jgi:PAS domain S-box-containing protein